MVTYLETPLPTLIWSARPATARVDQALTSSARAFEAPVRDGLGLMRGPVGEEVTLPATLCHRWETDTDHKYYTVFSGA